MQVEKISSEELKREYSVSITAEAISEKINERLKDVGRTAKMPGFRPGKIPATVLKKNYGKQVMGDVLEDEIRTSSNELFEQEGVRPAMQPEIKVEHFAEEKGLKYTMEFEVLPTVPELDYSDVTIVKRTAEPEDKDIDEALGNIAAQSKNFASVEGDKKAESGHAVLIDFKGFVGDEAFAGGEAQGHQLELGSNSFIPGFEEQLIGTKKGDKKDVNVTFPVEYHSEDLAGKDARFEVTVHDILEAKDQEISEELAKQLGFEKLEDLRDAVKQQLQSEIDNVVRTRVKKSLFDALNDKCDFDIPAGMVKIEFESIWKQVLAAKEAEPDAEEFQKTDEELEAEYQDMAKRRVRLGILLAELGRENEIAVSNEEINQAVFAEARRYPGQEQKVFEHYQQHPEHLETLKGPILEEKVVDFLLEKVKVTEEAVSVEELQKED